MNTTTTSLSGIRYVSYSTVQLLATLQADAISLPEPDRSDALAMIETASAEALRLFIWTRRKEMGIADPSPVNRERKRKMAHAVAHARDFIQAAERQEVRK